MLSADPAFRGDPGRYDYACYAFGDDERACARLLLLAEVFNPSSRALLVDHVPPRVALAVDLGCGPGATTSLVAEVTAATRTVGLDASPSLLAAASAEHGLAGMEFVEHDVTSVPFPGVATGADVMFARFLLAHLPDRPSAVSSWLDQVHPWLTTWQRCPGPASGGA